MSKLANTVGLAVIAAGILFVAPLELAANPPQSKMTYRPKSQPHKEANQSFNDTFNGIQKRKAEANKRQEQNQLEQQRQQAIQNLLLNRNLNVPVIGAPISRAPQRVQNPAVFGSSAFGPAVVDRARKSTKQVASPKSVEQPVRRGPQVIRNPFANFADGTNSVFQPVPRKQPSIPEVEPIVEPIPASNVSKESVLVSSVDQPNEGEFFIEPIVKLAPPEITPEEIENTMSDEGATPEKGEFEFEDIVPPAEAVEPVQAEATVETSSRRNHLETADEADNSLSLNLELDR